MKSDYDSEEWRLVPLLHWNWKWNAARSHYHTYEQELLAGVLVLVSQHRTWVRIPSRGYVIRIP